VIYLRNKEPTRCPFLTSFIPMDQSSTCFK